MGCTLNASLMKPLRHMRKDIEKLAKALDVDVCSKKLKLNAPLDILIAQTTACCTALKEISALTKADKHLASISASQLCVVNKTRDYSIRMGIFRTSPSSCT